MAITLPDLPYEYGALEPYISSATLKLHHDAHHRAYVDKANALLHGSELEKLSLEAIVQRVAGKSTHAALFNNAAQAWNHAFYWNSLRPKKHAGAPPAALAARLAADFGGEREFVEAFKAAALGVFGSGWVWLVAGGNTLSIMVTANADTPIVHGQTPLLVLDVWEHAYYLDYQSRRASYVSAVVDQLLNWEFAERNLLKQEAVHVG
jgi:Fe-Mn family superoxide dismutase